MRTIHCPLFLVSALLTASAVSVLGAGEFPVGSSRPAVPRRTSPSPFEEDNPSAGPFIERVEGYGGSGQSVWPATTPQAEPNFPSSEPNWSDSNSDSGFRDWEFDDLSRYRSWYFGTELLLVWGANPGDNLIGSEKFADLFFFPQAPNVFPHQTTDAYGSPFHYGARARLGWNNDDDSGAMLTGFYVFGKQQTRGPGRVYDGSDIHDLQTLASIPLDDGGNGQIVPFDSAFQQTYDQKIFGGDIDIYLAPFFARPSFQMKFLFGAKYLQIQEQFSVVAGDSGLGYVVNLPDGSIDYSTVTDIGIPPYEMSIRSQTRSQFVGPQIGVRYDLGNETIKVWGQTKFALAADFERSQLAGQNVVNGFQAFAQQGPPFSQTDNTTHVSPIFETSIYADFCFFAMLPLINQVEFLRQAQFRIGFDYLLVGEVARPANVIRYNTPIPALKGNRTNFDMKVLTLGITWNY